jgi:hypothetical protein
LRGVTILKKSYGKPDIVFDNFQMESSIGACAKRTGPNPDKCGVLWAPPDTLFAEAPGIDSGACTIDVDINVDTESYDGLCFHVPFDGMQLFTS